MALATRRGRLALARLSASLTQARHALKDNSAASGAEYALILSIIAGMIAIAAISLGSRFSHQYDDDIYVGENASVTLNTTGGTSTDTLSGTEVRSGQGAFVQPGAMSLHNWYPIEFVAGPDAAALSAESEESSLTHPRPIFVSKVMRVSLLPDPNFQIRPKSKALQETGADLAASWQWDVKPQAAGTHTLIAQVDVLKRKPDGTVEVFNRYSRRVSVRVGAGTLQETLDGIRSAESIGGALTALFKSWSKMLVALAVLIGACLTVIATIGKARRRRKLASESPAHAELETNVETNV